MCNLIRAEWLKFQGSFTRRFLLVTPASLGVMVMVQHLLMPELECTWSILLQSMTNWWVVLFVPLGAGLMAGLTAAHESRSGTWRALRTRPVAPGLLFLAKSAVLAIHTLLGALIFGVCILAAGLMFAQGPVPWGGLLYAIILPWVGALPVLVLHLWVSVALGAGASVGLALVGLFAGVIAAARDIWTAVPYAYGTRMITPALGVHPNGVPLEAGDPLLSLSVIPIGLGLSVAAALLLALVASLWFTRWEVR